MNTPDRIWLIDDGQDVLWCDNANPAGEPVPPHSVEYVKAAPASTGAELVACDCGDLYPPDSFGAGFIAARGECPNCDAGKPPAQDEAGALALLSDIRFACGDNGRRMQPDLVEYIRELAQDAERYRWLREQGDSTQWMNIIRVDPDDFESLDAAVDAVLAQRGEEEL